MWQNLAARARVLTPWRADGMATICGLLAAATLPPFSLVPLLFVALPGLLLLIGAAPTAVSAARRGFAFGMAHHIVGLWWITNAIIVMAAQFWWAIPIAVPLLAAALSVFIAIPAAIAWRLAPGLPRVLGFAGAWVLGDLARQFVLTGFPWNVLGTVSAMPGNAGVVMMQAANLATVHGLTWLIVLVALLPALGRRGIAVSCALVATWAGFGIAHVRPTVLTGMDVVLVQGNVPEGENQANWQNRDWLRRIFDRHLALTRQGAAQSNRPFIVVWPETASPWWLQQDSAARAMIMAAAHPALAAFIGAPRDGGHNDPRNSLIALGADGEVAAYYDKAHLVPYGEYFPSYLPFRLGERGWTPGPGIKTLHVPGIPAVGPLICFEAIFPGQVVDEADRPTMLVNVTSDSWFGDSGGPRQHLVQARFRAIEEGLPLLRAANTGISAVIDPYGRITARLGLARQGVVRAPIPANLAAPLATRTGLWAPLALALLSLGMGVFMTKRRARYIKV